MVEVQTTSANPFADVTVGAGLMAGVANVIMQLGQPGVGYGVRESKVDSGNLFKHPYKRARTTFTYLSVSTLGTAEEKEQYRQAVNRAHAQVRSDESSPVKYNAFDPELQLWVAACLFKGYTDAYEALSGRRLPEDFRADVYAEAEALGTTLQVRPEMWPANLQEFDEYWQQGLEKVSIDAPVRDMLLNIAGMRFLPAILRVPFGRLNTFITTGFLPPEFREQLGLTWSGRDQRRFVRLTTSIGAVALRLPRVLRQFPYNFFLWDVRRRIRTGRPLV